MHAVRGASPSATDGSAPFNQTGALVPQWYCWTHDVGMFSFLANLYHPVASPLSHSKRSVIFGTNAALRCGSSISLWLVQGSWQNALNKITLLIAREIFCVMFCRSFFCPFSFRHCVVFLSSIYGFWLPVWPLSTTFQLYRGGKFF